MKDYNHIEILQRIYDSKINISLGWMWDDGVDFFVGCDLQYLEPDEIHSTGTGNIKESIIIIANKVSKEYPNSTFAEWWKKQIKEKKNEIRRTINKWLS